MIRRLKTIEDAESINEDLAFTFTESVFREI